MMRAVTFKIIATLLGFSNNNHFLIETARSGVNEHGIDYYEGKHFGVITYLRLLLTSSNTFTIHGHLAAIEELF